MKTKLIYAAIIAALGILAAWIFEVINNERLLWIIGILSTSGYAFWQFLLKEGIKEENKTLRIMHKAQLEQNRELEAYLRKEKNKK